MLTDTADLYNPQDCTTCLFIPYSKLCRLPMPELEKIKKSGSLVTGDLMYHMSKKLRVKQQFLEKY